MAYLIYVLGADLSLLHHWQLVSLGQGGHAMTNEVLNSEGKYCLPVKFSLNLSLIDDHILHYRV